MWTFLGGESLTGEFFSRDMSTWVPRSTGTLKSLNVAGIRFTGFLEAVKAEAVEVVIGDFVLLKPLSRSSVSGLIQALRSSFMRIIFKLI